MATTLTFDTLKQDVRRYLERGNVADTTVFEQIPRLINNSERRIARELKIQGNITPVNSVLTPGVSVYAKPDRWRETVSINIGVGEPVKRTPVFPRGYEYVRAYWPDSAARDLPLFYADYNLNNWLMAPTPDLAYPMEVLYFQLPPLLDDANESNWLTEYAPEILLYGALIETTPFLKEDPRLPMWRGEYDRILQVCMGEDMRKILDRAAVRRDA